MYKNSKFTILLPTVIACSLAAGMLLGSFLLRSGADRPARRAALSVAGTDKLNMLLRLIDAQYVDTVRMDSLTEEIIPLILENLDPHSMYFSAKDLAQANETIEGEFDGIGVVFNMATDTVIALNVIAGGPSAKAGIQGGDRIVTVEDSTIAGVGMDQNEVVKRLRGPRGSEVRLGIQRSGIDGLIPVTVRRDAIPIKSITASYLIRPDIGYIKFDQFSVNAYKELSEAIGQLKGQGMQKLILDIRGNSGGLLEQAIAISNEFLPADKMIVYTQDRAGNRETQYSDGQGEFTDEQLVVLIDEYSASSSEILAGALQDNDRGTIIGRRSYGKGLVQSQIPFPDGSAVRLTVARYYTPTGRSIQKPYSDGTESYNRELLSRYEHNELFSADSIHFADSLKYVTEGGKVVYGGGGIMPDLFRHFGHDPLFQRGGRAQHALPFHARLYGSPPRATERNPDARGTGPLLRLAAGPARRIRPLCGPAGRGTETGRNRTLERGHAGPNQSLRRPQHAAGGQCFLPQHPKHRQRGKTGARGAVGSPAGQRAPCPGHGRADRAVALAQRETTRRRMLTSHPTYFYCKYPRHYNRLARTTRTNGPFPIGTMPCR